MMNKMTALSFGLRLIEMGIGLTALSFGTVLMIRAGLGQSTGTAMLTVFSAITKVRIGTLMIIMFFLFIIGELLILKGSFRPRHVVQIVVALVQGELVNYFQYDCIWLKNVHPEQYGLCWLCLCVSVAVMSFGSASIIDADLVQMPVEGFALEFSQYFKRNFGKVRQAIDIVWLILAALGILITRMPSTIREGTLFYTLVLGRSLNYTCPIMHRVENWLYKQFVRDA